MKVRAAFRRNRRIIELADPRMLNAEKVIVAAVSERPDHHQRRSRSSLANVFTSLYDTWHAAEPKSLAREIVYPFL